MGHVYAIEDDTGALAAIEANCHHFNATNVTIVAGRAPQTLHDLPDPDAIFIGGSGGALSSILEVAMARLRPQGSLVNQSGKLRASLRSNKLSAPGPLDGGLYAGEHSPHAEHTRCHPFCGVQSCFCAYSSRTHKTRATYRREESDRCLIASSRGQERFMA